jgi:hypothetical protein
MKNYLNILDTSEEDKEDKEHKFSFNNNTISLDTLSTSEKNIKKNAVTPRKAKPLKNYLTLARNIMNKEITNEINSSVNNSDKNTNKLINISSKTNNEIIEPENMRYRDIKERDDNSDIGKKHIRKDVYGKEIKKGGNHRITFADNVQMIKRRMKMEESQNINNDFIGESKIKRVRTLRRSLIDLKNMHKRFDMDSPERKKMNLVDIIEVENFKEFNKNDYLYPQYYDKEDNLENQEAICCSGICFVF